MPSVIVRQYSSPRGLPIAIAASPTETPEEGAKLAGVSPFASIFSTATSVSAS